MGVAHLGVGQPGGGAPWDTDHLGAGQPVDVAHLEVGQPGGGTAWLNQQLVRHHQHVNPDGSTSPRRGTAVLHLCKDCKLTGWLDTQTAFSGVFLSQNALLH